MATVCISKLATRPLYYSTDEKNPAFCRDDMWAVSTSELNAITTQRDELLAAAKEYIAALDQTVRGEDMVADMLRLGEADDAIRDAIAKAEAA